MVEVGQTADLITFYCLVRVPKVGKVKHLNACDTVNVMESMSLKFVARAIIFGMFTVMKNWFGILENLLTIRMMLFWRFNAEEQCCAAESLYLTSVEDIFFE